MEQLDKVIKAARILVVEDEEINLRLLERVLNTAGYPNVRAIADGSKITSQVMEFDPDLILLDLHLPPPDGFDILRALGPRINGATKTPVLVLTGDGSSEAKRRALQLGARDFLAKPFDGTEALLRIRNLLETRLLYRALEEQNSMLETRVRERTSDLQLSQIETIERLARAAEIRDDETGRHTQRVGELASSLALAIGLSDRNVDLIRRAAPLHDVGKIGIPDRILLKPGGLTDEEMQIMRTHTLIGARILSGGRSDLIIMAEKIALSHHECWDGSGYPHGLSGDLIPIEARIVAVADCVDALTHNRPYRSARPMDEVVEELQRSASSHFDPSIVQAMLRGGVHRGIVPSPPRPMQALVTAAD